MAGLVLDRNGWRAIANALRIASAQYKADAVTTAQYPALTAQYICQAKACDSLLEMYDFEDLAD